jgi:hypothetical protein
MVRTLILAGSVSIALCAGLYVASSRKHPATQEAQVPTDRAALSLPALDANGATGVKEIMRSELVALMTKTRLLSPDESDNLNRGCVGLTCLYQALGQKRWPESARGTVAYLRCEEALKRRCPNGQENFVFVKQGWWVGGRPPAPTAGTGAVPMSSLTRARPGFYTFNYAVYFPSTATYAWINHREYGFPLNLIQPQKAYLSASPPPLEDGRPAQIFCSTCR